MTARIFTCPMDDPTNLHLKLLVGRGHAQDIPYIEVHQYFQSNFPLMNTMVFCNGNLFLSISFIYVSSG